MFLNIYCYIFQAKIHLQDLQEFYSVYWFLGVLLEMCKGDVVKEMEILCSYIQLSSFPKIKIGNTYRIPKEKYLKWISDNIRKTIFL